MNARWMAAALLIPIDIAFSGVSTASVKTNFLKYPIHTKDCVVVIGTVKGALVIEDCGPYFSQITLDVEEVLLGKADSTVYLHSHNASYRMPGDDRQYSIHSTGEVGIGVGDSVLVILNRMGLRRFDFPCSNLKDPLYRAGWARFLTDVPENREQMLKIERTSPDSMSLGERITDIRSYYESGRWRLSPTKRRSSKSPPSP